MENRELVTIFWSGGWDGTFRMLQLAQLDVIVQPIYVNDPGRGSVEFEHRAMSQILDGLRKNARAQILDIMFFDAPYVKRMCADSAISQAHRLLEREYRLGSQYEWLALLCKKLDITAEVCVINGTGRSKESLLTNGSIDERGIWHRNPDIPVGSGQNELADAVETVMGRFIYPTIRLNKKDMQKIAEERGWMEIMKLSWFCHYPIGGQPCGLCHPCNDVMNYGMEWRMPDVSQERWRHRDEILAQAEPGIMSVARRISDHANLFRKATGRELDLLHPHDLNEKLQWLMIFKYDRNVAVFADKVSVREYVKQCGYEDILTRIYGVWSKAADVDWSVLPDKYVLKCNHGSGNLFYAICRGEDFDRDSEMAKLDRSLTLDYARVGFEYHYSYIEPKLYAEELLENADGSPLIDYKFYCFHGVPQYVKVIADRESGKHQDYYDMDWNFRPMVKDEVSMGGGMQRPSGFERMKEIAGALSKPFPMARVDLYYVDGRICFGEITLTPATGLNRTDKPETLKLLGELI